MKKVIFLLLWVTIIPSGIVKAQLSVDGEIRIKSEYRNGYKQTQASFGEKPEIVVAQRSRIGIAFKREKVNGRVSFQDVRTWGETPTKKDVSDVHLKEGWIEMSLDNSFSTRIGRQILKYDDERLLSATNWNDVGTQHDLLLLKYKKDEINAHAGIAYNNESSNKPFETYYPVPYYKAMGFIWFNYNYSKIGLSLIGINDYNIQDSSTLTHKRFTYGGLIKFNPVKKFDLNGSLYLQNGKNRLGNAVDAYMLSLKAKYSIFKSFSVFTGADVQSGNDPNKEQKISNRFDNLYGANHKYFGYLDYFPSGDYGIFDGFIGFDFNILDNLNGELIVHNFYIPHDYTHYVGEDKLINSFLGSEVDLLLTYKPSYDLQIIFLQSLFIGTPSMDIVKGGNHEKLSKYSVIMLTWTPSFLLNQSN